MYSDNKRFFNNVTTSRTSLRCPCRRDFYILFTSIFSFVFDYIQKHTPSCIRNIFRKIPVLNHVFNVKVLYSKAVISLDQGIGDFVAKIKSLVSYFFVVFSNKDTDFLSAVRTFFSTAKFSLRFGKFSLNSSKIFRGFNLLSIAGSNEKIKSNICLISLSTIIFLAVYQVNNLKKGGYAIPLTVLTVSLLA